MTKSPSILSVGSTQSIPEELSLFDFMSKYSRSLPLRVRVCKGFYGVSERTAVTTGDLLDLHFLKSIKVNICEMHHYMIMVPHAAILRVSRWHC